MHDVEPDGSQLSAPDSVQAPAMRNWLAWLPLESSVRLGAALLWALLFESAVDNVWLGSPIRRWLLAAFILSGLIAALGWKRLGWRSSLATAAALLLGEIFLAVLRLGSDARRALSRKPVSMASM